MARAPARAVRRRPGLAACEAHRQALLEQFVVVRRALDDFKPDVVVIWGDDQFENFQSDIIPAFCVMACEEFVFESPQFKDQPNVWDEPPGTTFRVKGHRAAGKFLALGAAARRVRHRLRVREAARGFGDRVLALDPLPRLGAHGRVPVRAASGERELLRQPGDGRSRPPAAARPARRFRKRRSIRRRPHRSAASRSVRRRRARFATDRGGSRSSRRRAGRMPF